MGINEQNNLYIPKVGDVVTGTVVSVSDTEALIDVGYSTEGVIYKNHLTTEKIDSMKEILKVDDLVDVKITRFRRGDDTDALLLSRLDILRKEKYDEVRNDIEVDKNLTFKVIVLP